jgi:hypothetical protein
MQPFLAWVLELDACFAERGFGFVAWHGLDAAAPLNSAFAAMRVPRGRAFTGQAGLRAQAQAGAAVGCSRRIVPRCVFERSLGSFFGALCFARAGRGARHALVDRGRRNGEEVPGAWG